MREWTELDMSFSAGGFLSASDGYCSAEQQLQYYGESPAGVSADPSTVLDPPTFLCLRYFLPCSVHISFASLEISS